MIIPSARLFRALPPLLAALALVAIGLRQSDPMDWHIATTPAAPATAAAELQSRFVSSATDQFVHAASVTALANGKLMSAWFGGSREGGRDVNIYGAVYDPRQTYWGANRILASRETTQRALGRTIRKLGNPVISQAPDGKLWLFYVSVSVGGWAGSAINASYSLDGGDSWSDPVRLITSPFANISTLVKGTPIYYRDGSIGLPIYHEFLGKFAELLRLDSAGRVLDKIRISHGKHSLQPVIVPADRDRAVALMRYAGTAPKQLLASHSGDGGKHWSAPEKVRVANPNSALSALRLPDGSVLGVMNDLPDGRHRLSLLRSEDDGSSWQRIYPLEGHQQYEGKKLPESRYTPLLRSDFLASGGTASLWQEYGAKLDRRVCEDAECRFIYDYPYLIQAPDGDYHLVYTWNKSFIKHLSFNQAWLDTLYVD